MSCKRIFKRIKTKVTRRNELDEGKILPVKSNAHFNTYLKEIASLCGIKINLTHHIAKKTFATTVLLLNDVPMEIVSKLWVILR